VSITLLNYEERYKIMTTTIIHKRRAVSPVIATVILIAVAVALGIAVAFWASGLTSSFSKYEKLGVSTQYSTLLSANNWNITLGGQNTGSSAASITQIQVNGIPIQPSKSGSNFEWGTASSINGCNLISTNNALPIPVPSGQSFCISFSLPASSGGSQTFADGQTIQVTIITAAGNNYPASIVLP
jgi:flagellin-like protein